MFDNPGVDDFQQGATKIVQLAAQTVQGYLQAGLRDRADKCFLELLDFEEGTHDAEGPSDEGVYPFKCALRILYCIYMPAIDRSLSGCRWLWDHGDVTRVSPFPWPGLQVKNWPEPSSVLPRGVARALLDAYSQIADEAEDAASAQQVSLNYSDLPIKLHIHHSEGCAGAVVHSAPLQYQRRLA